MRTAAAKRDNRYGTRLDVRVTATLREVGSSSKFDVQITDLSLSGFRCSTLFRLSEGQAVAITIPGLSPLEATVAWGDGSHYGCRFERALHVAVFDHLVTRFRAG
jgi:PilZ domain